jgi:hypothetical protein
MIMAMLITLIFIGQWRSLISASGFYVGVLEVVSQGV